MSQPEPGLTRVTVTRLPPPCPTIEVMRHLGKPLGPIVIDPWGPTVLDPSIFDP